MKRLDFEETKTTYYTTFKADIIKVVLVFSISDFFSNENSQGRKLSAEIIPSSSNSALESSEIGRI